MNRKDQLLHLSKDRVLASLIRKVKPFPVKKNNDLYLALLRAIVGQQLSIKAAATIWDRFLALYNNRYPQPQQILDMEPEQHRAAGLSYQKAGYLCNIASFALQYTLDYKVLYKMPDEDLINYLVQIKGVGRWTVEMLLMFSLGKPDVFPQDDLGIQNGMQALYGFDYQNKKQKYLQMQAIAEKWKPCRTLACMYIWKAKDEAVAEKKSRRTEARRDPVSGK